jgi:hypothetical protein
MLQTTTKIAPSIKKNTLFKLKNQQNEINIGVGRELSRGIKLPIFFHYLQ